MYMYEIFTPTGFIEWWVFLPACVASHSALLEAHVMPAFYSHLYNPGAKVTKQSQEQDKLLPAVLTSCEQNLLTAISCNPWPNKSIFTLLPDVT